LFSDDDDSLDEEDDDDPPWAIDWPIFIAEFLASSIAFLTFYLSPTCKSLSFHSSKFFNEVSIASMTSAGILLLNSSNCLFVVSYTLWA
jgi:hypothetical protein